MAAFGDEARLRKALGELEALGVDPARAIRVAGPAASPWRISLAARFERELRRGAILVLLPLDDDGAAKAVPLAMLRHSEGPVEVHDSCEEPA